MKHKNADLSVKSTAKIVILRGEDTQIPLLISAPSPSLNELWRMRGLKTPEPPSVLVTNPETGKYVRDAATDRFEREPDYEDPKYVSDWETFTNRLATSRIVDALRADPNIEFDTQKPTGNNVTNADWMAYLDGLHDEVFHPDTGFSAKEGLKIQNVSNALDGRVDTEGKMNSFLSKALSD